MKVIIIAGFDETGKTTLVNNIIQNIGGQIFKSTKEINSGIDLEAAIKHDWRFMLDFLGQIYNQDNIIFDRSFICQYVYSKVLRLNNINEHYGSLATYDKIFLSYCDMLAEIPHLIIHCHRQNFTNYFDPHVSVNYSTAIQNEYTRFFNTIGNNLNIIECPFENGIDKNVEDVIAKIEEN